MMVQNLNQPEPRRHVHWEARILNSPPAEPKRATVTLTPNTASQPWLASQLDVPWCGGPRAVMQVHRPISAPPPADPWEVRATPVPVPAGNQSNICATDPVANGQSIIAMPWMALPRSTPTGNTNYSLKELRDRRHTMSDEAMIYRPPPPHPQAIQRSTQAIGKNRRLVLDQRTMGIHKA